MPTSSLSTLARPTPAATSTPTLTPQSQHLLIPTLAGTSTPMPTGGTVQPPTATYTPLPPYPYKKVIFNYFTAGDHSLFDLSFGSGMREYSSLVLYDDGLMIRVGHPYMQKVLSPDQVRQFFSHLEALGFYSIESNQKHDPTDKLYNYGNKYQKSYDGRVDCVYANFGQERTLCAYEPDMQFLIPQMKAILDYFDKYTPSSMLTYYPDRVLLLVEQGRDPNDDQLPTASIPWRADFPALDQLSWDNVTTGWGYQRLQSRTLYVDGSMAKAIYSFLNNSWCGGKVVTQDGQEYTIYYEVVLPHEHVTNAFP